MNYNEIEKQLLNQSKKLLDEYKKLYINVLKVVSKMGKL